MTIYKMTKYKIGAVSSRYSPEIQKGKATGLGQSPYNLLW